MFRAYAESLPIDLGYQGFEDELRTLPGKYVPPGGGILIARGSGGIVGCVALRPMDEPGVCEMKRLFVDPAGRGLGVGKALVAAVVELGRSLGYGEMRLDTLPSMESAIGLYERAGFVRIPAYYETPVADTVFMGLRIED